MELICNPNLWGDSREILSSRHPPLHSEFEATLIYLRPDLNSHPTPTPPTALIPFPTSNKKQITQRRETKSQSMRITFISHYKNLLLSLTLSPQRNNPRKEEIQEKTTHLLLIADNYAFPPSSSLTFSTTLKYFPCWETWHREPGVSRKVFSLSAQVCARHSIFLRSTTVASQFGCSWDSQK